MLRTLAGIVLTFLAISPALPAESQTLVVEDWSRQTNGKQGIPQGWEARSNWGSPKYDFSVVVDGGSKVLRLRSEKDNSTIGKKIKVDLKEFPVLTWRWKAVTLPAGGDSRQSDRDDQAAQIYVVFPRFPEELRSRVIGYVWDTTAPAGAVVPSTKTGIVTYVIVRSGDVELGRWITETRNVYEDYKRIYGVAPGEDVGAVSVAIDSNDTRSRAESFIGEIFFRKP